MQPASRGSLVAGRQRLESLVSSGAADGAQVAEDLFATTVVLAGNAGLRRALSDPARPGQAKAAVVRRLLSGKVSDATLDLLSGVVRDRWASGGDLTDATDTLAAWSLIIAAERAGRLERVEDELFRFSRLVAASPELRDAFSSRTSGATRKAELVHHLLDRKAAAETVRFAVQAAVHPRGLRTEQVLEIYVNAVAQRRRQLIARVTAALPLTSEQRSRLGAILRRMYGQAVQVAVDVDPEVVGGLRVQIGDDVLDGTIISRINEVRRRLAG